MCIHKPGVPTGYLEAKSLERTRDLASADLDLLRSWFSRCDAVEDGGQFFFFTAGLSNPFVIRPVGDCLVWILTPFYLPGLGCSIGGRNLQRTSISILALRDKLIV